MYGKVNIMSDVTHVHMKAVGQAQHMYAKPQHQGSYHLPTCLITALVMADVGTVPSFSQEVMHLMFYQMIPIMS